MKALWLVAGLLGLTAGTLTWIIGFPLATVSYAGSIPTTTLALLIGAGGYLMFEPRQRRWSWALVVGGLALGPFVRGAWKYFLEGPLEVGALCLAVALIAAARDRRTAARLAAEQASEDDPQP